MSDESRNGQGDSPAASGSKAADNDGDFLRQASRLMLAGRLQDARDMLRRGLEHEVGDPKAMSLLGKIEFRLGNNDASLEIWQSLRVGKGQHIAAQNSEVTYLLLQSFSWDEDSPS